MLELAKLFPKVVTSHVRYFLVIALAIWNSCVDGNSKCERKPIAY